MVLNRTSYVPRDYVIYVLFVYCQSLPQKYKFHEGRELCFVFSCILHAWNLVHEKFIKLMSYEERVKIREGRFLAQHKYFSNSVYCFQAGQFSPATP